MTSPELSTPRFNAPAVAAPAVAVAAAATAAVAGQSSRLADDIKVVTQSPEWHTVTSNKHHKRTSGSIKSNEGSTTSISSSSSSSPVQARRSDGEIAREYHDKIMYGAFFEQCSESRCKGITSNCYKAHSFSSWQAVRRNPKTHDYCARLCYYMQQDERCLNGENCVYAHSKSEVSYHPDVYKTRACHHKPAHQYCGNMLCSFYHVFEDGSDDQRTPEIIAEQAARLRSETAAVNTSPLSSSGIHLAPIRQPSVSKVPSTQKASLGRKEGRRSSTGSAAPNAQPSARRLPSSKPIPVDSNDASKVGGGYHDNCSESIKSISSSVSSILSVDHEASSNQFNCVSSGNNTSAGPLSYSQTLPAIIGSGRGVQPVHVSDIWQGVGLSTKPPGAAQASPAAPSVSRSSFSLTSFMDQPHSPVRSMLKPWDHLKGEQKSAASRDESVFSISSFEDKDVAEEEEKTLCMFKKLVFYYRENEGPVIFVESTRPMSSDVVSAVIREFAERQGLCWYKLVDGKGRGPTMMYLDHNDFMRTLQRNGKEDVARSYASEMIRLDNSPRSKSVEGRVSNLVLKR
eukprot:TRINITY_DN1434_c0_g1_i1.p1 TRINITY_DN1434_c0_g1~~TRINITY_DN1434_c0_g1_i1.p1  ORF type:complete len:571 (-),score=105.89 TRINITY_DN1434_c0_g1_i1:54-1766(-)